MPNLIVCGLDVSPERIDAVILNGARIIDSLSFDRGEFSELEFAREVASLIDSLVTRKTAYVDRKIVYALELNMTPRMGGLKQGLNFTRKCWLEGALLANLGMDCTDRVRIIERLKGNYFKVPAWSHFYAMQASGGKDAKKKRRDRIDGIYGAATKGWRQDQFDAADIAHSTHIALNTCGKVER